MAALDLRRLEVFARVVEEKSFSRAAERLYLAQPTISEHIRSLEEDLGVQLLDRLGREVVPTRAGELLLIYAKRLLHLVEETGRAMAQFQGKLKGNLKVGGSTIPGQYILPGLLGPFREKYPGINLSLVIGDTRQITEKVLKGDLEVGAVGAHPEDPRLDTRLLAKDDLILAVPAAWPQGKRERVDLKELLNLPFIIREPGSGTRRTLEQALNRKAIQFKDLKVVAEMGTTEAVRQGIKAGLGASILSKRAIEDDLAHGTIKILGLKGITLKRDFYLITHTKRAQSPICLAFVEFAAMNQKKER
jgi:DNA-binding transcriptional LysR family regulator